MNALPDFLHSAVRNHRYPLLFATISGAHLYGFPSKDSDYDLRGLHVLPVSSLVGFEVVDETIESSTVENGVELDLVTHDIKKFFLMMLKRNGYVLEQLYSPLVVFSTPEHTEIKEIGRACITRHHSHHYLGFAQTQWRLFEREIPHRVKPLLYVYRVLLTGIHLMRTGEIEANLVTLNLQFALSYIDQLIERKLDAEHQSMPEADVSFYAGEYTRLMAELESAANKSHLPDSPSGHKALEDLMRRVRLGQ